MILRPHLHQETKTNFSDFYYFKSAFTDDMLKRLDDMIYSNGYKFENGKTSDSYGNSSDDPTSNVRRIAYVNPVEHSKWLYDTLEPLVLQANRELYNFDIQYVTDPIHYVIYPPEGGHLRWHMDVGYGEVNRRKLSLTVQLSDPSEYEGGDFHIWYGGDEGHFITMPKEKGTVLIFPSFLMHRVTPVTKGTRKALVFWTGGEPYK